MKLLLLLAYLLAGQEFDFSPGKAIDRIVFKDRAVPRLRYALELREELRKMERLCGIHTPGNHTEDWERTVRAIADGATLVEIAVCHHEKKTRRTLYRVVARWLEEREYPQASVVEGVDRR